MDRYCAFIRVKRPAARSLLCARLDKVMTAIRGVDRVDFDASTDSICVTFDRATVSLGDLVRLLEDSGMGVAGVSQAPDVATEAATA